MGIVMRVTAMMAVVVVPIAMFRVIVAVGHGLHRRRSRLFVGTLRVGVMVVVVRRAVVIVALVVVAHVRTLTPGSPRSRCFGRLG